MDQVLELRQEVEDNQELIIKIKNIALLNMLRQETTREVKEAIEMALAKAFDG